MESIRTEVPAWYFEYFTQVNGAVRFKESCFELVFILVPKNPAIHLVTL